MLNNFKGLKKFTGKILFSIAINLVMIFGISSLAIASEGDFLKTTDPLKFREEPSLEALVIQIIPMEAEVYFIENVDGEDGSFTKIEYAEKIGFVKSEFLVDINEEPEQVVELLSWSEAKYVVEVGEPIEVYDIYTGRTYYVKSFSNGLHADVEPITVDDTYIMKETFGGVWKWDPRPVWVTINGRTLAASINGMPHGGGVNSNNGMNGQICLHFEGSTTHNGNRSFAQWHQDVLMDAYYMSVSS